MAQPQNRIDAIGSVVEKLGGKVTHGWFAFGDYEVIAVVEMPSNIEAAGLSIAASAAGALRSIKTTPLLTATEAMEAMRKSRLSGYRAPLRGAPA